MSDDDKAKARRGGKIVLKGNMLPLLSQHQREWLRRTVDEIRERRAMPPHLRAHYEGLAREADARKKAEGNQTDDEKEEMGWTPPTP